MTWFGTVSAWAAAAMGVLFCVNAFFFHYGLSGLINLGAALLLFAAAFRTLRKMSGGLRLLAGAWGVAAGLVAFPSTMGPETASPLAMIWVALALTGLALTVLHKETK